MEGPSLVILREELQAFKGKKVLKVSGNSKLDIQLLQNKKLKDILSWGKHLILVFDKNISIRIHFLMFGSYRINEKKDAAPRLSLVFKNGELNFYSCSIRFLEEDIHQLYDWRIDLLSEEWDEKLVLKKVRSDSVRYVCDLLMDQAIFAGLGNIIKNEVLYNLKIHPLSKIGNISSVQQRKLVKEARSYSFKFYEWKKAYELKKHWNIYRKRKCPVHGLPVIDQKTGKSQRRSFYCPLCQKKY